MIVTCNQPFYKTNVELSNKFTLFPLKIQKYNYSIDLFLTPLGGHLKVFPMKDTFDKLSVVYGSYDLLTTHHQETKYLSHEQQQIWMPSFSYRTLCHWSVPQTNNLQ